jgi:uncharacterized membrane protein YiaA
MMNKVLLGVAGFVIMLIGLWLGGYLLNTIEEGYAFASLVTGMLLCAAGAIMLGKSANLL